MATDLTPLGTASASSIFNASQSADKAIDDNLTTQWAGNNSGFPYWWKIDFGVSNEQIIDQFTIQSRNDAFWEEIPEDWTFEGSNNDSDWDILATYIGIVWSQNEQKTFDVSNTTPYRYYRFNISDNQSTTNNNTSLLEVEMFQIAVVESDSLQITDSVVVLDTSAVGIENLQISDSVIVLPSNQDAKFATKIISINPLIFVTDTDPLEIIKVDTTDPENLTWEVRTVNGVSSAKDVAINSTNDFIYIAGNAGQVVKVEIADLLNQTIFDLSDTDNLLTIETNSNFGITYAGTDNEIGELYTIDERSTFSIDSDFRALSEARFLLEADFNIIATFKMDSDFKVLSEVTFKMDSDFKCLTKPAVVIFPPEPPDPSPPTPPSPITPLDTIEPIKLTDYQVFIDSVELEDTDLILNSISITHLVGEESSASFQLSRKHDQLNTTLQGNTVTITNQNIVEIKCKGITIFPFKGNGTGRISELNCQYNEGGEFILVNALSEEATNQFNNITMSLPSLNERLSLYDILVENPRIFNPFIDPNNEENPKLFKGIRVDLGTQIQQSVSKFTLNDENGSIADGISDGTFNPIQNWTYFWSPTLTNLGFTSLGSITSKRFFYIGTSLSPVSEDLWELELAGHFRQRIRDDIETELGFYEVGEAPFQEISVRNGEKIVKARLVDEDDRLSSIKDAGYNFIDYAKLVADLEYEKLLNINQDSIANTSCTFNLTIDAYLYYDISLLTQINIDNTTESNIYNNNNGFPVSAKSITITSANRKVDIEADNIKSTKELEELDSEFPDEDADEYNTEATRTLIYLKTSLRTNGSVE